MDKAGWQTAGELRVPENLSLVFLPPYSPELNPIERLWLHLRDNRLSHRVFQTTEGIMTAAAKTWNWRLPKPAASAPCAPIRGSNRSAANQVGIRSADVLYHRPAGTTCVIQVADAEGASAGCGSRLLGWLPVFATGSPHGRPPHREPDLLPEG